MGSKELTEKLSLAEKTEAFFPEHDIETRFDVIINNEDLDLVNKIRYWMNTCLSKTEPDEMMRLTQTISLDKAQKGIKEAMETLLVKEREMVEKEGLSSGMEYRCTDMKCFLVPCLELKHYYQHYVQVESWGRRIQVAQENSWRGGIHFQGRCSEQT